MPTFGPGQVFKISGWYLLIGAVGSIMVWTALENVSVADFLRSIVKLQPIPVQGPAGLPPHTAPASGGVAEGVFKDLTAGAPPAGTALGAKVAQDGLSFVGKVPYVWAGETPAGWDCSGFVSYVLHVMNGIELPDDSHTVTAQFYTWSGAQTVHSADAAPGDLACWASHIGIVIDKQNMVNAAGIGLGTRVDRWDSRIVPAIIRRPKAYALQGVPAGASAGGVAGG